MAIYCNGKECTPLNKEFPNSYLGVWNGSVWIPHPTISKCYDGCEPPDSLAGTDERAESFENVEIDECAWQPCECGSGAPVTEAIAP
ncbi:MAG: hypothetical protein P1U89_09860 [Verrucomicrobiales bacterium]|nr:hypothetical protein [Verrucomicrobiales bacterium]